MADDRLSRIKDTFEKAQHDPASDWLKRWFNREFPLLSEAEQAEFSEWARKRIGGEDLRALATAAWDDVAVHLRDEETVDEMVARLPEGVREFVLKRLTDWAILTDRLEG